MAKDKNWTEQFPIQLDSEVNFIVGSEASPVGVRRSAPKELKQRVAAASMSYFLGLKSIDYTLKHYVGEDWYPDTELSLGDEVSDFIKHSLLKISQHLVKWHTQGEFALGRFGAEWTLFKVPHILDVARFLANHGRFLEVLPILRQCLEMISFSYVAFNLEDDSELANLKTTKCLTRFKTTYATVGKIYGLLSEFAHWQVSIQMLSVDISNEQISTVYASAKDRAKSLVFSVVLLDIFLEAIRGLYKNECDQLLQDVQGTISRDKNKNTYKVINRVAVFCDLPEITKLRALLQ